MGEVWAIAGAATVDAAVAAAVALRNSRRLIMLFLLVFLGIGAADAIERLSVPVRLSLARLLSKSKRLGSSLDHDSGGSAAGGIGLELIAHRRGYAAI